MDGEPRGRLAHRLTRFVRGLERLLRRLERRARRSVAGLRRRRSAVGTTLLAVLILAVALGRLASPPEARPGPAVARPILVAYFENGWGGVYEDSFPALQEHAGDIDFIMPFWLSAHPDGRVEDRGFREEVVSFARAHGLPVAALVNNIKGPGTAAFLEDEQARAATAEALTSEVLSGGLDGLHVDFELLPPGYREEFTDFVSRLRAGLGPERHLSAAVFPPLEVPEELTAVYDYTALAGLCDFLVVMAYDHHYSGGPPGPVSPTDWVERNIAYMLEDLGLPPGKLVLAVGAYGYDWPEGGVGEYLPSDRLVDLARQRGAPLLWDEESQNPYFVYYEGSVRHEVWYQDERIMAQRVALARRHGLRGLALWRLGFETPETWAAVADGL
ncbi:MAG: hypothetical protein K6U08_00995 [Firmicutes bacterium]|nr:hypothetical protein [Bacillota bacterium]